MTKTKMEKMMAAYEAMNKAIAAYEAAVAEAFEDVNFEIKVEEIFTEKQYVIKDGFEDKESAFEYAKKYISDHNWVVTHVKSYDNGYFIEISVVEGGFAKAFFRIREA